MRGSPDVITRVLAEQVASIGCEGIAVVRLGGGADRDQILSAAGTGAAAITPLLRGLTGGARPRSARMIAPNGRPIMAGFVDASAEQRSVLALWRSPRGPAWDDREMVLVDSLSAVVRVLLNEGLASGTGASTLMDELTCLPTRALLLTELGRHFERLDQDGGFGTLVLLDIDRLKAVNDAGGREAGDAVLIRVAARLRDMVRPADIVARVGGDEFVLWLNGMDQLTAAERMEGLRAAPSMPETVPGAVRPALITLSAGIATRANGETVHSIFERVHAAVYQVKVAGGAHWKVAASPAG